MSGEKEGQSKAYERIRDSKTLEEILTVATSFEESAHRFYSELVPRVSKNLRYLVEELAREEQQHYDLFSELARHPDIQDRIQERIRTPVEDHRFSDYVHLPDMGDSPDDQAILQYAMGREDSAMKQYRELADNTEPGPAHDLFEYLANEEAEHKLELEKQYYELVYGKHAGKS